MKTPKIHYAEFNWSQTACGKFGAHLYLESVRLDEYEKGRRGGFIKTDKWKLVTCKKCKARRYNNPMNRPYRAALDAAQKGENK